MLGQTDFQKYKVIFSDILVYSYQLELEPKAIGEGTLCLIAAEFQPFSNKLRSIWHCVWCNPSQI